MGPRGMGATSSSLRKPNSRSQTIEMAANMLENSTVIVASPGTRNDTKSGPAPGSLTEARRPNPNAINHRNGRTMLVTRLRRSRRNLIMSRRQSA